MESTEQRYQTVIHYGHRTSKGTQASVVIAHDSLFMAMNFVQSFKAQGYHVQQVHGGLTAIIPWHSVETISIQPFSPQ